ncbi:MAG: hypothetical protein LQ338_008013 [Usnochroma carphineum]|nr:MAG: hypothetical protein LQ338_008013 [Usnochroma carphineum]
MASVRPVILFVSLVAASVSVLLASLGYVPAFLFQTRFYKHTPAVVDEKHDLVYHGFYTSGVDHFQNIFYAQETSGPNRFAPPIPLQHPQGTVVDATSLGAFCPQGVGGPPLPFASPVSNISEDCLSLRIARPNGISATAKLPVVVWIHGGTSKLPGRFLGYLIFK